MATDKKSVLLYCDILHTVKELSNEEAGQLFKHYLEYINDLNPEPPNKLIKIVFEPIKQNLKRDLKKWEVKSLRNSKIAKEGWDKRRNANGCERIKSDANYADKDKVIVTDKVKDKVIVKDINNKESLIFPYSSESFMNTWNALLTTPKWKKKKGLALQASLKKLSNHPESEAIKMMENTIAGDWQGLFPLKENEKEPKSKINQMQDAYNEGRKILGI